MSFRGRLLFRQYIKGKYHNYGVKMFKLCAGSGYTRRLQVFAGKQNAPASTQSFTINVVKNLMHPYLDSGRELYNSSNAFIDLSDQFASYGSPLRRSIKCHRKTAFELLLNTCLVNA
ncbi:hypothetical protein PR048_005735 [Dryococelus australis]|uniref:PiggyBac transposable element-derived protein domain-containing protein n=1 Tax=Dryococelus australis TaxID=614101 RepID=A0ABQ9I9K9_9NEOP|nr:hypothetical protein PR048_005735 [Dryococelus australis]